MTVLLEYIYDLIVFIILGISVLSLNHLLLWNSHSCLDIGGSTAVGYNIPAAQIGCDVTL